MSRKTMAIQTPQAMDNPADVKVEEIPLPPEELWNDLDNSGSAEPVVDALRQSARPKAEVESLDFVTPPVLTIPLDYQFRRNGAVVDAITVRRLTVAEVGEMLDELPAGRSDNFEIYARMTGLPAPVLRGLIDSDGERVAGACYDFLPRVFRPAGASPSDQKTGDA